MLELYNKLQKLIFDAQRKKCEMLRHLFPRFCKIFSLSLQMHKKRITVSTRDLTTQRLAKSSSKWMHFWLHCFHGISRDSLCFMYCSMTITVLFNYKVDYTDFTMSLQEMYNEGLMERMGNTYWVKMRSKA